MEIKSCLNPYPWNLKKNPKRGHYWAYIPGKHPELSVASFINMFLCFEFFPESRSVKVPKWHIIYSAQHIFPHVGICHLKKSIMRKPNWHSISTYSFHIPSPTKHRFSTLKCRGNVIILISFYKGSKSFTNWAFQN